LRWGSIHSTAMQKAALLFLFLISVAMQYQTVLASDEGFLGFGTIDYSADDKKNVEYMGVSLYERSEDNLQSKFSFQMAVQDDLDNETRTFFGFAASSRYRFGSRFAPFIGAGAFYGETNICNEKTDKDEDSSSGNGDEGDEACFEDRLLAGFTEIGINWLITGNFFIEAASRQNYTSKSEPFDARVNAFSIGFRY
jgi:hypothetical protein